MLGNNGMYGEYEDADLGNILANSATFHNLFKVVKEGRVKQRMEFN